MLLLQNWATKVTGTGYRLEYVMTKNASCYEISEIQEYGLNCVLYGTRDEILESEEIRCITPDFSKICVLFQHITKNQVFPVHSSGNS